MKIRGALAAFLVLRTALAFAQEYRVALERPTVAGAKQLVDIHWSRDTDKQIILNSHATADPGNQVMKVEVGAVMETVAVTSAGRPTEVKFTVRSCKTEKNGKFDVFLRPGDVIVVKAEPGQKLQINGSSALGLQANVLPWIFRVSDWATDENVFRPDRKMKVGENWPVHAEVVEAKYQSLADAKLGKNGCTGTVKLDSVSKHEANEYLNIAGEMHLDTSGTHWTGVTGEAASEVTISKNVATILFAGEFPVNTLAQIRGSSENLTAEVTGQVRRVVKGQAIVADVHLTLKERREVSFSPFE